MMSRERLEAKATGGRMKGWTLLHLLANGSDDMLLRTSLVEELLQKGVEVDPRNDKHLTPFLLAAGTGVVDVAGALSQFGADIHAESLDRRNAADRCAKSSKSMKTCSARCSKVVLFVIIQIFYFLQHRHSWCYTCF